MILIIAEKPSLAKAIAVATGSTKKETGYFEGANYIVSFAYGHLFSLKDVDDYIGEKTPWKNVPLPFIPPSYEFKLRNDAGVQQQYKIIKTLMKRPDVKSIVNCGDADREGQLIIDNIIFNIVNDTNINKPIYRLWLNEQTNDTILSQLKIMKQNNVPEYRNLFNEGLARTFCDWAYGINITRLVSLKSNNTFFPCGRVLIPIVKAVYDRDMAIKNFIPSKYYILESDTSIKLSISDLKYDINQLEQAKQKADELNNQDAIVTSLVKKQVQKKPLKLFSLSSLQRKLSIDYKMGFEISMSYIQKLYEAGLLTYPRTNTEYLATGEKGKIRSIIESLPISDLLKFHESANIFDDSKIESHSAITITAKKPDYAVLSGDEKIVYDTVFNRFVSNFLVEPCLVDQVKAIISIGDHQIKLVGETIVQQGFLQYEKIQVKSPLPPLEENQKIEINFCVVEKEKTAPKKLSESALSKYLENPLSSATDDLVIDYDAVLKGIEIGTQATRTGIIENAKKYKYISIKSGNYSIEPLGEMLINILEEISIDLSVERSVHFSVLLKSIYKEEITLDKALNELHQELEKWINDANSVTLKTNTSADKTTAEKKVLGNCPRCNLPVYEGKSSYYCNGFTIRVDNKPQCGFILNKDNKYFLEKGKKLTATMVKTLLAKGKVHVNGLKPKDKEKKPYDAMIIMEDTGKWINFRVDYSKS